MKSAFLFSLILLFASCKEKEPSYNTNSAQQTALLSENSIISAAEAKDIVVSYLILHGPRENLNTVGSICLSINDEYFFPRGYFFDKSDDLSSIGYYVHSNTGRLRIVPLGMRQWLTHQYDMTDEKTFSLYRVKSSELSFKPSNEKITNAITPIEARLQLLANIFIESPSSAIRAYFTGAWNEYILHNNEYFFPALIEGTHREAQKHGLEIGYYIDSKSGSVRKVSNVHVRWDIATDCIKSVNIDNTPA